MIGANPNRINPTSHLFKVDKWKVGPLTRGCSEWKERRDEWEAFREAFKKLDAVNRRG